VACLRHIIVNTLHKGDNKQNKQQLLTTVAVAAVHNDGHFLFYVSQSEKAITTFKHIKPSSISVFLSFF